jgi:hypothetical protein
MQSPPPEGAQTGSLALGCTASVDQLDSVDGTFEVSVRQRQLGVFAALDYSRVRTGFEVHQRGVTDHW